MLRGVDLELTSGGRDLGDSGQNHVRGWGSGLGSRERGG